MAAKKRSAVSFEDDQAEVSTRNAVSINSNNKKLRKDEKDGGSGDVAVAVRSSSTQSSIISMEKKKKRKALDKERKRSALRSDEGQPKKLDLEEKAEGDNVASSSGTGLPEFHIDVFKDLASGDTAVREAAIERMVRELQEVQKAYDGFENKDLIDSGLILEAEKDDGLNNCAPAVRYAVRRLIRGLSSSRQFARHGFALGLAVLLGAVPSIRIDSVLKLVVQLLETSSSMKGQEFRDCLLGRLFVYGALVRSDRLTREWASDKNTPYIGETVSDLLSLAGKKLYLQEPAVSIILELVEKLPVQAVVKHVLQTPGIVNWFEEAADLGNPDALFLALQIREKLSNETIVFSKLLPNPFSPSKFFSVDHLSSIQHCFKKSTFCQPRVHSLWPVLLNILLPDTILQVEDASPISNSLKKHRKGRRGGSSEEVAKNVQSFCEAVIDGALVSSSHDRKHLALDILLLLLQRSPASFFPIIFSNKVVQCLMDVLSTKDSWLYKAVQHFLRQLSDQVKDDDTRRVALIVALQKHSNGKLDSITKTRTVKDLMADFKTEAGCMLFIENLTTMFLDESNASEEPSDQSQTTDDNSEMGSAEERDSLGLMGTPDFLKIWVIESLPSILKHLKVEPEGKYRVQKEILKFLAVQGLFSSSIGTEVTSFELQEKFKWPKAATSTALCKICIEQLMLLLANTHKVEERLSFSGGAEANDLGSYFMRFFSTLRNIPSVSLFISLGEEDEMAVNKLLEMESRLSREERSCGLTADANKLHAMRYLLIQLLLQVLLRPREFFEAASDLVICCKKVFQASDDLDSMEYESDDNDTKPELMDVLIDALLALLSQASAPMRCVVEQLFKYFCCDVTDDGLLRMLRIIKKDLKPARHQNDEETEDDDDDGELLGIEEDEDVDEAGIGETGESDVQTDDSEAFVEAEGSDKELTDEESDGGMDDDVMFRMDKYLAQIFKEKKNQAGNETAVSQLLLFKLRILSLLEIYLHENRGKHQILTVYSDLARALIHAAEGSEQLGQRIWGILQRKVFKEKKIPHGDSVELPVLESLLERNLKLASKSFKRKKGISTLSKKKLSASLNRQKMIVSLAQSSTYWILKIIYAVKFTDAELQRVFGIVQDAIVGYFDSRRSQIKSGFFKEIFRRHPRIGQHCFNLILGKCGEAQSDYRRIEALDLVYEILKSLVSPSSDDGDKDHYKKVLKRYLVQLSSLIGALVSRMPAKQLRRSEVVKFCGKIFQMVSTYGLKKSFFKRLRQEADDACKSHLGELYLKYIEEH